MSQFPYQQSRPFDLNYATDDRSIAGFFNAVYAWMCVGLAVTATVAWLVSQSRSMVIAISHPGMLVAIMLGLAVLSWAINSAAQRISTLVATGLFLLYAAILGAALSFIFLFYSLPVIGGAFLMTAGTFGAMSVYGYVTKRDLTRMGSVLVMVAIGLFLASIVNIFLASGPLSWIITYAVLGVFIGLTAYHTQMLRQLAYSTRGNPSLAARYAIVGSLILYVDFINIFVSLLRIMGSRR